MLKFIRLLIAAIVCASAALTAAKVIDKNDTGMQKILDAFTAAIESKRNELISASVFLDGVTVNGVSVSGMTMSEAKEALVSVEEELKSRVHYTVEYGKDKDKHLEIGEEYFTFSFDTESVLLDAIMLCSEGTAEEIENRKAEIARDGLDFEIACNVSMDKDAVAKAVREAGKSATRSAKNASVKVVPESVYNGGDRFVFTPEKKGYRTDPDKAIEKINKLFNEGEYGKVTMYGHIIQPDVKVSDLEGKIVRRSYYKSSYSHEPYNAPNRVANIIKACGIINGYVLSPKSSGENYLFSCNKVLGPRTAEGGWLPAPGFVDSGARSVDSPGGGVCHVSSTLYNAVIKADLEIAYRINHSSHVGYVPWGLDATIDTNGPDFKFINNTEHDIYIFIWVNTGKQTVNCEIWGDPFPEEFDKIDFYAELLEEVPPTETEYIVDKKLQEPYWYVKNTAKTGYKYQSFKQYKKNGEPVGDPVPVARSVYRMHPMRICVWEGYRPGYDMLHRQYRLDPNEIFGTPEPTASPAPTPAPTGDN